MVPDTFSHYSVAQANVRQRCHKRFEKAMKGL
jgi:hypothetical protein